MSGDAARRRSLEELPAEWQELAAVAREARRRAHAPYSGYRVGAAVRSADGRVRAGCNVEISSYGLTMCAERVALFSSRAAGDGAIVALAVVGPDSGARPTPPCGACRQVIADLAPGATILLVASNGTVETWRTDELLPSAFGPEHLERREPEREER